MSLDLATTIGAAAAICSTASFAPQAWKIIKTRTTKDISAGMYCLTVVGFGLWCGYGVLLAQWPLIASNGICLFLSAFILIMKLMPQSGKRALADAIDPANGR